MKLRPITLLNHPNTSPLKAVLSTTPDAVKVKERARRDLVTGHNMDPLRVRELLGLPVREDTMTTTTRMRSYGTVLKYEEGQPREPAGTSIGGRFAAAGAGSTVGGGGMGAILRANDHAKFLVLKRQWAKVNNDLLAHIDHPDSPEAVKKMSEMKDIVKDMYRLKADPGGTEGIGLPGGPRDLVIVGTGPGGLAAAVMGGTDGLDTLFIDASQIVGGQAKFSSRVENYPGFPAGVSGVELAAQMHEQAQRVGAEGMLGVRVTGMTIDEKTELKTLTLSNGTTITTRAVILAGGVEFKKMEFEGSDAKQIIYGDSQKLTKEGAGKPVVIIGGSNGAAQAALSAAQTANQVTVLSRSSIEKGMSDYQVQALRNHPKITVIEGDEIVKLEKDHAGNATSLTTKHGQKIPSQMVGVFVGGGPDTKWLPPNLSVKNGKIAVDGSLETNIPGVFAVGDIRQGSIGRIGTAVGDGQVAERNVFEYFRRVGPKKE